MCVLLCFFSLFIYIFYVYYKGKAKKNYNSWENIKSQTKTHSTPIEHKINTEQKDEENKRARE